MAALVASAVLAFGAISSLRAAAVWAASSTSCSALSSVDVGRISGVWSGIGGAAMMPRMAMARIILSAAEVRFLRREQMESFGGLFQAVGESGAPVAVFDGFREQAGFGAVWGFVVVGEDRLTGFDVFAAVVARDQFRYQVVLDPGPVEPPMQDPGVASAPGPLVVDAFGLVVGGILGGDASLVGGLVAAAAAGGRVFGLVPEVHDYHCLAPGRDWFVRFRFRVLAWGRMVLRLILQSTG